MEIDSVTLRATNDNFESIIHSLKCLDKIISGGGGIMNDIEIAKYDISVIKKFYFVIY